MKFLKVLRIIVTVLISLIGLSLFASSLAMDAVLDEITTTESLKKEDVGVVEELVTREEESNVVHIALLGIDALKTASSTTSRSDAIKLLSLNMNNKTATITSIQRDMLLLLPGNVQDYHKLNHAYWHDGPKLTLETINYNFDLDVSRYVALNFDAFKLIIDSIGGIDVNGVVLNNGEEALAYLRNRSDSDYYRMDRQTETILAIFEKIKTFPYEDLLAILTDVLPFIETNLTKDEIIGFAVDALTLDLANIESYHVPSGDYSDTKSISYNGFSPLYIIDSYQDMVKEVHQRIYDITDYEPSARIKETEAKIYEKFGRVN